MKRISGLFVALLLIACFACHDDEPVIVAQLKGQWQGMGASYKVNPDGIIPAFTLKDDKLPITLDFDETSKVTLTDSKNMTHVGSYSRTADKLTIAIDYSFELIELSGEYTIEELTDTTLHITTSREGSYTHPDTGQQFDGKVVATFSFGREVTLK